MKTSNIILKLSYNIIFIFYKKQYIWALITIKPINICQFGKQNRYRFY